MPFQFNPGGEVDAEVVGTQTPPPVQRYVSKPGNVIDISQGTPIADPVVPWVDHSHDPPAGILLYEKRARAISLFVELPLLTLVAMHDKTPGLIRLGAAILALWKSVELARGGAEDIRNTAREWVEESQV